jgi:hypothetical protein
MPQKKNPDVPELVRGKTGRVYGHLTSLLTIMKSIAFFGGVIHIIAFGFNSWHHICKHTQACFKCANGIK